MRLHRPLDDILGSRSKVALLRFLVRFPAEKSGRELARELGLAHRTCQLALRQLAEQGVVEPRRVGTARVYRINHRNVLVQDILAPAFEKEDALLERFVKDLRRRMRQRPVSLILFGSVARQEERPTSDVDLLFIAKDPKAARLAQDEADALAGDLAQAYGNVPMLLVIDRKTFARKVKAKDSFYLEVVNTGRVVFGKSVFEILKNGR